MNFRRDFQVEVLYKKHDVFFVDNLEKAFLSQDKRFGDLTQKY